MFCFPENLSFLSTQSFQAKGDSVRLFRRYRSGFAIDFDDGPYSILLSTQELDALLRILKEARYRSCHWNIVFPRNPPDVAFWCPEILDRNDIPVSFSSSFTLNLGYLSSKQSEQLKSILCRIQKRMFDLNHLQKKDN